MAINIDYNKNKTVKIITDTNNPRIYHQEYVCFTCGQWIDEVDVIFADKKGKLTFEGNAYCDNCLPSAK